MTSVTLQGHCRTFNVFFLKWHVDVKWDKMWGLTNFGLCSLCMEQLNPGFNAQFFIALNIAYINPASIYFQFVKASPA